MPQRLKSRTVRHHGAVLVSRQRRLRSAQRNRRFSPIALRERPSPDATFYPAGRRSAYNGGNPPQSPQRSKLVAWVASPDRLWGNPNARSLCRETLIKDWLPPGSPVAYGGKPAPKLPQRGEPAQGTSLCSAGFTARRCSPHRSGT
jgi:hypothetical protein